MQQEVNEFLDYLAKRGRKEITIQNYRTKLSVCMRLLEEGGFDTSAEKIDEAAVFYLRKSLCMKEESAHCYLKVIGYFTEWKTKTDILKQCDLLWNNPQIHRLFLDDEKFMRLLSAADAREKVILMLGGYMGLRRAEISNVRYSDIQDGYLIVRGKGHGDGKEAHLRIPPVVIDAINQWTAVRRKYEDRSDGRIVVSYQSHTLKQISLPAISHIVRDLGKRAGVKATTHSLRRYFATSLYEKKVDISDIKTLMRHENVNTTINCYINPNANRLDEIMENIGH